MLGLFRNNFLYSYVELQRQILSPMRSYAKFNKDLLYNLVPNKQGRTLAASYELFERTTRQYPKPEFDIYETKVGNKKVSVSKYTVIPKAFCHLVHFKKDGDFNQKKMLIVAPMSGHHATLLRGTVEGLLPYFDVYITDWVNARDIPVEDGDFHFDDFVNYSIEFMRKLGPDLNVLAVCQPSVPVLAAVSLMSAKNDAKVPSTLTMMGGPIDTRQNPTEVNDYAAERTIQWFENNVVTRVPMNYPGALRYVYPGFIQLYGFMAMNLQIHMDAHWNLFQHLVEGDGDNVASHKKFYNEYLAVMDLPAEFYLETVNIVFKKHALPRGKLVCSGTQVDPTAVKDTALLCIEGARDDISGREQTKAALRICTNVPDKKKLYHLQKGVGHYGIFNGRRYREHIVPVIRDFVKKNCK